jgi:ABC-type multidrug transport system fused ATPase/permease subunit
MSINSWVTASVIALFFDWRIAALVAGVALPTLVWAAWYTPRLKRYALESREATSDLTSRAQEVLTGVRVIKAYGQEEREQARFEADSVAAFDAAFRTRWLFVLAGVVAFTIGSLFMLPAIYLMSTWASVGRATVAAGLIALVGLSFSKWNLAAFTWSNRRFGEAMVSLRDLNTEWAAAQDNTMGLARVFAILDTAPEVVDAPDATPLEGFTSEVRFENVGFSYEPGRPILKDISFTAAAGSVTAIVGPTGSGKSTLVALLLRLFDPDQGRILLDGRDLREFTLESLRAQIAIAPQEPVLFASSVADNIRYAAPEADDAAMRAAAEVACAQDFVGELPQGWATVLGERGAGLSPGQKQRLCIARALIKQAPILILDEPTASLDAETEHRLMQNLGQWGAGKAVFIITHRFSTIRRADHILFIEDGRVAEAGAHATLMADSDGRYRAMVSAEQSLTALAEPAQ